MPRSFAKRQHRQKNIFAQAGINARFVIGMSLYGLAIFGGARLLGNHEDKVNAEKSANAYVETNPAACEIRDMYKTSHGWLGRLRYNFNEQKVYDDLGTGYESQGSATGMKDQTAGQQARTQELFDKNLKGKTSCADPGLKR